MNVSREKSIAMVVTILFFAACGAALYYSSDNKTLNGLLNNEKLKSEKMLSQKLGLEKDIKKLEASIADYKLKNKNLDGRMSKMNQELANKQAELKKINDQSWRYKKQLDELTASKNKLQGEMDELSVYANNMKIKNDHLLAKVSQLENNSEKIADRESSLKERNALLSDIVANNYSIEAHKRKNKLTVNSKKTKKIEVGLEVPVYMSDNLTIEVTNPEGVKLSNRNSKTISYRIDEKLKDELLLASISDKSLPFQNSKRVAITYQPTDKFKSGTYQINIYYQSQYLGSSQIRLK